jgi:hypothetical protein
VETTPVIVLELSQQLLRQRGEPSSYCQQLALLPWRLLEEVE